MGDGKVVYIDDESRIIEHQTPEGTYQISVDRYGNIWKTVCYDHGKQFHRFGKPALTIFYPRGGRREETYYSHNKLHREDGPAIIKYDQSGRVIETSYWCDGRSASAISLFTKWITESANPTEEFVRILQNGSFFTTYSRKFVANVLLKELGHLIDAKAVKNVLLLLELIE